MLLRRVIEHVKEQNWTAIAIDFCIVVIGVFVGIQVANWNEGRQENQRAHDYLKRLSEDLSQEMKSIDNRVTYVGRSISYGESALSWAEDGKLVNESAWETVLAYYQASRILPYSPVDTTYQEMRSAGELGLVSDASLRAALTEYFVSGTFARADYITRFNPPYRAHVRGLTPFRTARFIGTACFDTKAVAFKPCEAPIDEAAARAILHRYAQAPGLQDELRFWVDSAHQMVQILEQQRLGCLELKQRIDAARMSS